MEQNVVVLLGLEPRIEESKSSVLPLHYETLFVAPLGLEPSSSVSKTDIINPYKMEQFVILNF